MSHLEKQIQERIESYDRRNQEWFGNLSVEEQEELEAEHERMNQASIREFGSSVDDRWEQFRERQRQTFQNHFEKHPEDYPFRDRYTIPGEVPENLAPDDEEC